MSWNPQHKIASRDTILLAAAQLFTQMGFDAVGIDQIMQRAGMTRGAFYAHFKSKSELYAEAVLLAGRQLVAHSQQLGVNFEQFVALYLAPGQVGLDQLACPLACLITDIAQREEPLKKVYEQLFGGFVKHLQHLNPRLNHAQAQACASSLIGAQAVARSLNSPALAQQLLQSAQENIINNYTKEITKKRRAGG
jgi:TetR/AcrR family transcriptional regulator, transcriptional repressor for nem operon